MTEEPDEVIFTRERINKCKKLGDKEAVISCVFDALHDVTKAQDIANLIIRGIIDDSNDPRWLPIDIIDNANAVILGISERKGNPKHLTELGGYVDEKMDSLRDKWNTLKWKRK